MKIKAPVIHVNRTNCCHFIIGDKNFCMKKARFVFVDFYSRFNESAIICLRIQMDKMFIPVIRSYNSYIYTTFCRKSQCGYHAVIHNQIWSVDIKILSRIIDNL